MKTDDLRFLLLLGVVGVVGYAGWRAWSAGGDMFAGVSDTLGGWGESLGGAWDDLAFGAGQTWDSVTETIRAPVNVITNSTPSRVLVANITKQAVPIGGASVQQRHVTDLPEGSYQAAAMFWSLHPNDVFYD